MTQLDQQLKNAVSHALAGEWDAAHRIVQRYEDDETACWIHAVLHRIEGDTANARYWYRRIKRRPPEARTPQEELAEIRAALASARDGSRKRSGTRTAGIRARR